MKIKFLNRLLFPLFSSLIGMIFLSFSPLTHPNTASSESERSIYFVVLDDLSLPRYDGHLPGYPAVSTAQDKIKKIATDHPYAVYLAEKRGAFIDSVADRYDLTLSVEAEFAATFNGFAVELTADQAVQLAQHPAVLHIEEEVIYTPLTDAGPDWVNAPALWQGLTGLTATRGANIVIGIMDTGIDPWNPAFADLSGDGYDHTNPLGSGNYLGVCDSSNTAPAAGIVAYDPSFPCNDKLIGVWGFAPADANPRDTHGHGSHTAATAAGNVISAGISTPDGFFTTTIQGVAPQANIIMYDVCSDSLNSCPGLAQQLAWEQILLDGVVDVVNYSIGSPIPTLDVWSDLASQTWLSIRDAGIFVAASAGNWGPDLSTIGAPADLPWLTIVGAGTHNRALAATVTISDTNGSSLSFYGLTRHGGSGLAPVVFAADYENQADLSGGYTPDDVGRCSPGIFPPGTFSGEIVVCRRDGFYSRVSKGQTVLDGGAGGLILAQPEAAAGGFGALVADAHVLPGVHITYSDYQNLIAFQTAAPGGAISGTIDTSQATIDPTFGSHIARFSSRGPASVFPDVLVPAVFAPGVNILSAHRQGGGGDGTSTFRLMDGTSMSSPHVAGAAALLKALHPEWTPQEIASALMLTARPVGIDTDGVDIASPFVQGSGQIDLGAAGASGLIMEITTADFEALNPAVDGKDPETLNFPTLIDGDCQRVCSWERTVTNGTTQSITWSAAITTPMGTISSVTPDSFTLAPDQSITLQVFFNAGSQPLDTAWLTGEMVLTPDQANISSARFPVAVYPIDFVYQSWIPVVKR